MRYQLSFCEIEQLSDSIFEVTTAEGAVIDDKCAKEANDFWFKLRKKPFCLLVNNINSFSFSFAGSIEIILSIIVLPITFIQYLTQSQQVVNIKEEPFTTYSIYTADECFLTGTAAEVLFFDPKWNGFYTFD